MLPNMSGYIQQGISSVCKELKSTFDPLENENSKWNLLESEKQFVSVDIEIIE